MSKTNLRYLGCRASDDGVQFMYSLISELKEYRARNEDVELTGLHLELEDLKLKAESLDRDIEKIISLIETYYVKN